MKKNFFSVFTFGFGVIVLSLFLSSESITDPDPVKIYHYRIAPAGYQLFSESYTVTSSDALASGQGPEGTAEFVFSIETEDVYTCGIFYQREWFEYQVIVKVDGNTVYSKTPIADHGSIQTNIYADPDQIISVQLVLESINGCDELDNNATLELSLINGF